MKEGQPGETRRKDYKAPPFLVEHTRLHVDIFERGATVTSTLTLVRNPDGPAMPDLVLDGGKDLETTAIAVDGRELTANEYQIDEGALRLFEVPERFELKTVVRIDPEANTGLEGLYKSGAIFCTQCEAEGFRNITWYPDRPDVMSRFTTTIVADKHRYPVLLSNGNDVDRGEAGDRHWVTWQDPFMKPSYLFALVAGDLQHIEDEFVTMSGRRVTLRIFTEAHNVDKVDYAMASLKNAMRWDEEVYGREYDLDVFMIVAVESFNMGAMENKGLNIFNTSCVLAHPDTTTDADHRRVESVVAHEYFHNWSGNRVTCRDWFQLSLKEGFTVMRDQQFSADMGSPTVCRVQDVAVLRNAQFPEDAGPMAHPVRPDSFIEIRNFYTATVYEKGAEVVRMLRTLLGPERFRAGTDLYFDRHDGQAVTIEDFVRAMEDAGGVDLSRFRVWYRQAGTPRLKARGEYDADAQTFTLSVEQSCPPTPGQDHKDACHLPLKVGLLDGRGVDMRFPVAGLDIAGVDESGGGFSGVLNLTESSQTYVFRGIESPPTPSLLRGFSAPVKLEYDYSRDDLMFLMSHDTDGFNRWEAGQRLALGVIRDVVAQLESGGEVNVDDRLAAAFEANLTQAIDRNADPDLDKAMIAHMLVLPSESYVIEMSETANVDAIHAARQTVGNVIAGRLGSLLLSVYRLNQSNAPYRAQAGQMAERALKNAALAYLMQPDDTEMTPLCVEQYRRAGNMTDTSAALRALVDSRSEAAQEPKREALRDFYNRWADEALVVDLWFAIQAACHLPGTLDRVRALLAHEAFDIRVPNRMRALVARFAGNTVNFHQRDGGGYRFLADRVIELNGLNPQMAARILSPLTRWRKFDAGRQALMQEQLQRILEVKDISADVYEVVSKSL